MNITDFFIGGLLMNALPHFIFGITNTKFLGLFGYTPAGNIAYALLQAIIALCFFHYKYNLATLPANGMVLGALLVLVFYFVLGKIVLNAFTKKNKNEPH